MVIELVWFNNVSNISGPEERGMGAWSGNETAELASDAQYCRVYVLVFSWLWRIG